MFVRGCRGLRSVVAVTYYNFRFVKYMIDAHCLDRKSTTLVSHLVVVAHHQAALFGLEYVFD